MDYSARHRDAKRASPSKKEVGDAGEELAAKYLLRQGYDIRERNLRLHRDEIDIVAFDPKDAVLVFVEVKTRSKAGADFYPEMDVHQRKLARIRRSARAWVSKHDYEGGYRLDLICVVDGRVTEHFKELDWGKETE